MLDHIFLLQKICTYALLAMTPYPQAHLHQLHEGDVFQTESKAEQPHHHLRKQVPPLITSV
jgi:hypothetical protein